MFQRFMLFMLVALSFLVACEQEDDFLLDASAELTFSTDTLRFDTVFTELGSATRILKIYNPNNQPVRINRIALEQNPNSSFRINVDGISSNDVADAEIAAGDSLYVFAEVTVDPDNPLSVSPFVITENLLIDLNGIQRTVLLEAWGQNANYIPSRFGQGGGAVISCNLGEVDFNDPKPYVIYGALFIDSCTLNIPAGTEIYIHGGIVRTGVLGENYNDGYIFTFPRGRLNIQGTAEQPVIIQGDRLEPEFGDVAGQWGGIYLTRTSRGNRIEHAIIKNARFGIIVDSAANLTIKKTQILNAISGGLIGIHSRINAENCLFAGNGGNAVQLEYGGNYDFTYCTLASYGVDNAALRMSNALCLDQLCTMARPNDLYVRFKNSIIFGSRTDEIELFNPDIAAFNYNFENCVVKVDDLLDENAVPDFFDNCQPCIPGRGERDVVLFVNADEEDYHLDSLSIADGFAVPVSDIDTDLQENTRSNSMPDAGCFERE